MPRDSTVDRLAALFVEHPVWVEAMRRHPDGVGSTVYFSHRPGEPWRLMRQAGSTLLLPGAADHPDFVFRFSPFAVDRLAETVGGADAVAVILFDLILEPDEARGVGFRIAAPFRTLVRHGHLRLLLESGPKVFRYGAKHRIVTVPQLAALVRRLRASGPQPWEVT